MKVAGVQMDIALGQADRNLQHICDGLREAALAGATLVVFPECAVQGYCFVSLDEALEFAGPVPGMATDRVGQECAKLGCYAVFGLLEIDAGRLFNSAVLVGPRGLVGTYRKVHLPLLGIDQFASYGNCDFSVHEVDGVKLGINICYDANFPEASRCLALLGADLIALPTNWVVGPGSLCTVDHVVHARALDNAVYFMAVNRVGDERGFTFMGRSKIVGPDGQTVAECSAGAEGMMFANIDVTRSRQKHVVRVAGRHESHRFADRQPEKYKMLSRSHNLTPPWRQ
jgi:predicted amidohydrolase